MKLYIDVFNEYAKQAIKKDKNCFGKYHHSHRVNVFAMEIANTLKLTKKDKKLIYISSLYHDIGRFNQWLKYKTYNDIKSLDHGDEGKRVFKKDISSKLDLDKDEIKIIVDVIYYHNKINIDEIKNEKVKLYCKIVRDADMLDILKEVNNVVDDKNLNISDEVIELVRQNKLIPNELCVGQFNDINSIIRQLCFVFTMEYKYTLEYYKNNLLDNKINLLKTYSKDKKIDEINKIILEYIEKRIKEC